jgi:pseudouridine-5'-phosphate glycosidase
MHNTKIDKTELEQLLPFQVVKKLFGEDVTTDEFRESLLGYIILLTKAKSLDEKIEIYNNNIIGDWFNKYKKYSILLTPITISDIIYLDK